MAVLYMGGQILLLLQGGEIILLAGHHQSGTPHLIQSVPQIIAFGAVRQATHGTDKIRILKQRDQQFFSIFHPRMALSIKVRRIDHRNSGVIIRFTAAGSQIPCPANISQPPAGSGRGVEENQAVGHFRIGNSKFQRYLTAVGNARHAGALQV